METEIKSKSELEALAKKLSTETSNIGALTNSLCSTLGSVSDYDGIQASSAGRTLSSDLKSIMEDFNTTATNINSYVSELIEFDVNDFQKENFEDLESPNDIELPDIIPSGNTIPEEVTEKNSESEETKETQLTNEVTTVVPGEEQKPDEENKNGEHKEDNEEKKEEETQINKPQPQPEVKPNPQVKPKPEQSPSYRIIETERIKSEDGLTQRSALENIKVTVGGKTDISVYTNNDENGFVVTTGNYAYELNEKDVELLYAIVAAEGDKSYDDSLALMSTLLNRCEDKEWITSLGKDPIAHITAIDQFKTYQTGNYMQYLGGNVSDAVKRAVNDALKGVRNHNYLNFSKNIDFSTFMITETGNRYK